jgi:hypothetical protein
LVSVFETPVAGVPAAALAGGALYALTAVGAVGGEALGGGALCVANGAAIAPLIACCADACSETPTIVWCALATFAGTGAACGLAGALGTAAGLVALATGALGGANAPGGTITPIIVRLALATFAGKAPAGRSAEGGVEGCATACAPGGVECVGVPSAPGGTITPIIVRIALRTEAGCCVGCDAATVGSGDFAGVATGPVGAGGEPSGAVAMAGAMGGVSIGFPQLPQKRPSMGRGPPQCGHTVGAAPDEKVIDANATSPFGSSRVVRNIARRDGASFVFVRYNRMTAARRASS